MDLYDEVTKYACFLLTYLKSQKGLSVERVEKFLLNFILAWDKALFHVPYFNKLHFLVICVIKFIEEYGIYWHISAEGHESVHILLAETKGAVSRMASTQQYVCTFHAGSSVNLKKEILEEKQSVKRG